MICRSALAFTIFLAFAFSSFNALGATALEMASFCKSIEEAKLLKDSQIYFDSSPEANQCWGAFDTVQQLLTIQYVGDELKVPE